MADPATNINDMNLTDRAQLLFDKLREVDRLDALINLTCSILDASLYICDHQGQILAHSTCSGVRCEFWANIIASGQVEKKILKALHSPRPYNSSLKEEQCGDHICTRLIFPLKNTEAFHMYSLCIFFWDHSMTYEDQCLASILAGAFSALLQRQSLGNESLQSKQARVLRELLDYKAGLKSYFLRSISQTGLQSFSSPFRILALALSEQQKPSADMLALELAHRLPDAWCFPHSSYLLAVFNEERLPLNALNDTLHSFLVQQHLSACLSMPFYDLLKLRYMFEDCQSILPIAMKKEPGMRIHMAEHYQCTAFLSRCQQYFPLQDYYPEGLTRLLEYDRENNRSYLTTLTAYLENNMNANAAAKSIFMHRNTMMQQLEKIEQIMGVSLQDKEMCLYLQLCLRIHELLNQ